MIQPQIIVCLGVTAAQSVFGKVVRLHDMRGRTWNTALGSHVVVTNHPSAVLRHPKAAQRDEEYRRFVDDLRVVARFLRAQAA